MIQKKERTQKGCWKCKERRVRCTEERPTCQACAVRGHSCHYGIRLVWEAESRSKGVAHGRVGVWSKNRGTTTAAQRLEYICHQQELAKQSSRNAVWTGCVYFIHTTFAAFGHATNPMSDETDRDEEMSCTLAQPMNYSTLRRDESSLFQFFVEKIAPNCTLSSTYNPYLEYIVPLAHECPALMSAVLGISACELQFAAVRDDLRYTAVRHKTEALRRLQEDISQIRKSDGFYWTPMIAATTLMLCFFEISESCSPVWTTHMLGARKICDHLISRDSVKLDPGFRRFYLMYFVAHEVMGHTAWQSDVLFDTGIWFADDDEAQIDETMGASRGLMHHIASVSMLASGIPDRARNSPTLFRQQRDKIERGLHGLHQVSRHGDPELESIAETKRLCALIYFYARLDNLSPHEAPIPRLKTRVLDRLKQLPVKGTLLWSLFILGTLGTYDEDDRRSVLDMLQALLDARPLSSIRKAKAVIVEVWKDRDLGNKPSSWEALVKDRRSGLSLA